MAKLNVQFTAGQHEALMRLAAELGTTRAGVLKRAAALLAVALRERRAGLELAVVRGDHVLRTFEFVGANEYGRNNIGRAEER